LILNYLNNKQQPKRLRYTKTFQKPFLFIRLSKNNMRRLQALCCACGKACKWPLCCMLYAFLLSVIQSVISLFWQQIYKIF